jgi:hypothetical protein
MYSDNLIGRLSELNVLEEEEDEQELTISAEFNSDVEEFKTVLENDESRADMLDELFEDENIIETLQSIADDDILFVSCYCALSKRATTWSQDDRIRSTIILSQLNAGFPRSEGAPDAFLPVRGDQLSTLLQLTPRAIVYVWKDDCDPCTAVKGTFEEIFEQPPENISLFAVHGPEWAEELYTEYKVSGAPTALFISQGSVDARLTGPRYQESYEGEVKKLQNMEVV